MSTETAASDSTILNAGVTGGSSAMLAAVAVGGALLLVLVLASVAVCYLRRRIRRIDGKAQPVSIWTIETANYLSVTYSVDSLCFYRISSLLLHDLY